MGNTFDSGEGDGKPMRFLGGLLTDEDMRSPGRILVKIFAMVGERNLSLPPYGKGQ